MRSVVLVIGNRPALGGREDGVSVFGELMELAAFAAVELLIVNGDGVGPCGSRFLGHILLPLGMSHEVEIGKGRPKDLPGRLASVQAAFLPLGFADACASWVSFLSVASSSARVA